MAGKLVITEPVFIEENGQRVAVILPIDLYESLQAGAQSASPAAAASASEGFEREKAVFERLKPELLKQYPGKFVAIANGQVAEVGDDKLQVIERVRQRMGRVSLYVQQVTDQPHVYHVPYRKALRP